MNIYIYIYSDIYIYIYICVYIALNVRGVVPATVVVLKLYGNKGVTGQINGVADIKPAVLHPAGCIGFFCAKQVGVDHDKTIVSSGRRNTGNGVRSAWCRRGALPVDAHFGTKNGTKNHSNSSKFDAE